MRSLDGPTCKHGWTCFDPASCPKCVAERETPDPHCRIGTITCKKCGAASGDDWSQCEGACPWPMSPYYGATTLEAVMADALKSADRREALCRLQPCCPSCGHEQVQLVDSFITPAEWRCRMCKTPFTRDLPA